MFCLSELKDNTTSIYLVKEKVGLPEFKAEVQLKPVCKKCYKYKSHYINAIYFLIIRTSF